jgi:hypothetical protein
LFRHVDCSISLQKIFAGRNDGVKSSVKNQTSQYKAIYQKISALQDFFRFLKNSFRNTGVELIQLVFFNEIRRQRRQRTLFLNFRNTNSDKNNTDKIFDVTGQCLVNVLLRSLKYLSFTGYGNTLLRYFLMLRKIMITIRCSCFIFWAVLFAVSGNLVFTQSVLAQTPGGERRLRYTYVRRADSREGDQKVVTVPATNPRQAKIDAQTYHLGWDAVDAWMGQSRVMYHVLLKKRAPYITGTPPVLRPIPQERQQ